MIPFAIDALSWALLGMGVLLVFCGGLGLVRFPDFYTRLHAAGITDTLGAELILIGLMLQADSWNEVIKLLFIGLFMFITSPVATHAIAHAAYVAGLRPLQGPYRAKAPGEAD